MNAPKSGSDRGGSESNVRGPSEKGASEEAESGHGKVFALMLGNRDLRAHCLQLQNPP